MLGVCISFPWLTIIQAASDRDPGPNENTLPDMPRRCSIGSGGIGQVAEFVLESCGDSDHPGASEPNLAPRTARGQANWGLRFLDVLAFRFYYRIFLVGKDRHWERQELREKCLIYADIASDTAIFKTLSPNTQETETFIRRMNPDLVLARCKVLLKESVFSISAKGTFVMHPGICPEYRNAHGCFWTLANRDLNKVGMTLLRIDKGVGAGDVLM